MKMEMKFKFKFKFQLKSKSKLKLKSEKGQALFEFLLFLPFLLILYSMFVSLISGINGSINQQKITRGFFYNDIKNNSNIPKREDLARYEGIQTIGMYAFGWLVGFSGKVPIAACYEIQTLFSPDNPDNCLDQDNTQVTTQFVRPKTVYGICGQTYNIIEKQFFTRSQMAGNKESCLALSQVVGRVE